MSLVRQNNQEYMNRRSFLLLSGARIEQINTNQVPTMYSGVVSATASVVEAFSVGAVGTFPLSGATGAF